MLLLNILALCRHSLEGKAQLHSIFSGFSYTSEEKKERGSIDSHLFALTVAIKNWNHDLEKNQKEMPLLIRSLTLTMVDMTDIPPACLLAAPFMSLCGASGNNFPSLLVLELEQCDRDKKLLLHHYCTVISICQSICATFIQLCHLVTFRSNYHHKHHWAGKSYHSHHRVPIWYTELLGDQAMSPVIVQGMELRFSKSMLGAMPLLNQSSWTPFHFL